MRNIQMADIRCVDSELMHFGNLYNSGAPSSWQSSKTFVYRIVKEGLLLSTKGLLLSRASSRSAKNIASRKRGTVQYLKTAVTEHAQRSRSRACTHTHISQSVKSAAIHTLSYTAYTTTANLPFLKMPFVSANPSPMQAGHRTAPRPAQFGHETLCCTTESSMLNTPVPSHSGQGCSPRPEQCVQRSSSCQAFREGFCAQVFEMSRLAAA